ncbi:hypothetical protein N7513_001859 [Penicillium frequentans]|nr:hypothetical protein N7513_001859 [Penicillium glabrum]
MEKERGEGVWERRASSWSDAPRLYIDGGRREAGGGKRQIPIGASWRRQTPYGRAKPQVDRRDPVSGGGPTGAKPKGGGAETGGGPANRNSTGGYVGGPCLDTRPDFT